MSIRIIRSRSLNELHAVHHGHFDIGQKHLAIFGFPAVHFIHGLNPIRTQTHNLNGQVHRFNHRLQTKPNTPFIIDD
ncbi:hypothetical protein D3C85_1590710 [compost metagenome]